MSLSTRSLDPGMLCGPCLASKAEEDHRHCAWEILRFVGKERVTVNCQCWCPYAELGRRSDAARGGKK